MSEATALFIKDMWRSAKMFYLYPTYEYADLFTGDPRTTDYIIV
jgi:hypothetical protein